jgi:hypothetical protein
VHMIEPPPMRLCIVLERCCPVRGCGRARGRTARPVRRSVGCLREQGALVSYSLHALRACIISTVRRAAAPLRFHIISAWRCGFRFQAFAGANVSPVLMRGLCIRRSQDDN